MNWKDYQIDSINIFSSLKINYFTVFFADIYQLMLTSFKLVCMSRLGNIPGLLRTSTVSPSWIFEALKLLG